MRVGPVFGTTQIGWFPGAWGGGEPFAKIALPCVGPDADHGTCDSTHCECPHPHPATGPAPEETP